MTNNNPITTENLEHGDMIRKEGQSMDEVRTVIRVRHIDHERGRIESSDGDIAVSALDDVWELVGAKFKLLETDNINDSQI